MKKLFNLEGKVAIITGGYGHLGHAMSLALNDFGCHVVVAGRSEEKFQERFGGLDGFSFKECDILHSSSFEELYAEVNNRFGAIDIVINNAHSAKGRGQEKIEDEHWLYTMEGVLVSVQKSIKAVIPYLKKQHHGKIINISSMYGVVSPNFSLYEGEECSNYLNPSHYGAAKAGIIQLTKYYASYLGEFGINVNCVSPGPFPKQNIQDESPEFINRLKKSNPLGKIGTPEDIGGALVYLSSHASDFVNGHNLVVDGGWTIW